MTSGIEPVIAERFIAARLKTRGDLLTAVSSRLHAHAAPQATEGEPDYPFVLWTQNAVSADVGAIGGILIWAVLEYVVRVVGQTNTWDPLVVPAAEIDVALDNTDGIVPAEGGIGEGVVHACTRVRPFLLPEIRNGVQYRHLGGVYRLLVKGA